MTQDDAKNENCGKMRPKKRCSDKTRWLIRVFLVALQLVILFVTVFTPKTNGPTLVTLLVIAFTFPLMFNAVLLGLVSRKIRVIGMAFVLLIQFLLIFLSDRQGLGEFTNLELIIAIIAPISSIILVAIPEPAAGTDVLGLSQSIKLAYTIFALLVLGGVFYLSIFVPLFII